MTVTRKVGRWAGMRVAKRAAKAIPFLGTAIALYLVRDAVKRKGLMGGVIHSGLDALPYFGALKNGIELFTDDWIPDLPAGPGALPEGDRAEAGSPTSRTRS